MGKAKYSGRKEETKSSDVFPFIGDCHETKVWDNEGRKSSGKGKTEKESRDNAYKHWREKYE